MSVNSADAGKGKINMESALLRELSEMDRGGRAGSVTYACLSLAGV